MSLSMSLNDAFASAKQVKPETVGETVGGTITNTKIQQVTDYTTSEPQFWPDGKPKEQLIVSITTPEGVEGAAYIKLWGQQRTAMMDAIRQTGLDADHALAPGNKLWITFTGEEPNTKNPRLNATKLYVYRIEVTANLGGALDGSAPVTPPAPVSAPVATPPAPAAPVTPPAPVSAPVATPPAPAAPAVDPNNVQQLFASGFNDEQVASFTGLDVQVVATLRQNAA
ncbi:hypothetical protein [Arcanobacterium buesumense]|uniref:Uncharacterized protein n=1 Tax=Arcanobacterium buesumense TaxID=2722751 RepID=A0A6H2ELS8_9ACTO|nr:hypothetical protein [Arcanobacterium buesumense]QJC22023.1 hypothetical protein HC352_05580 [Arcanobacterium buesumense]